VTTIKELEQKIRQWRESYYLGSPIVSDQTFDELVDKLKKLDPENEVLKEVGAPPLTDFEKVEHETPMGSLDKITSYKELETFIKRISTDEVVMEDKGDGSTVSLKYVDGKLVDAATRGDGKEGERVFGNAQRVRIPHTLKEKFTGYIRGEVVLKKSVAKKHFPTVLALRNYATGVLHRKEDPKQESKHLVFLAFDVVNHFHTEWEKMEWLKSQGFETVQFVKAKGVTTIQTLFDEWVKERNNLDYEIDGVVIKTDNCTLQTKVGAHSDGSPKHQVAYKFPAQTKESVVKGVEWGVGTKGTITPVVIIDPVVLVGAKIERVSAANVALVEEMGLGIGDTVLVSRRGDVIPAIEEVLVHGKTKVQIPTQCPSCYSPTQRQGRFLVCSGSDCGGSKYARILHWIKTLDIEGFGDKLLEALMEDGTIKDLPDLYKLKGEDISNLEGWGNIIADKVIKGLYNQVHIGVVNYMVGLSIPHVGHHVTERLVGYGIKDPRDIFNLTKEDIRKFDEWKGVMGDHIYNGLQVRKELGLEMLKHVSIVESKKKVMSGTKLKGLSFCVTGTLPISRNDFEDTIRANGGEVRGSVGKGLSYLVTQNPTSNSTKNQKAYELGTEVITYEKFLKLLDS